MGTVLRWKNLRFCIYPRDHGPPHVHVVGPDGLNFRVSLIDLRTLESQVPLRAATLTDIIEFIQVHQDLFIEEWEFFHGQIQ
jgi:hypothetical protein